MIFFLEIGVAAMVDMWNHWNNTNDESVAGLVLLAADIQAVGCGDIDFSDSNLPMAQILASNDGVLNKTRTDQNRFRNSNATFFMDIYGANHASFGAYNDSKRFDLLGQVDGEQLIPSEVVWDLTAAAIANVASRSVPLPIPKKPTDSEFYLSSNGPALTYSSPLAFLSTILYIGWIFLKC